MQEKKCRPPSASVRSRDVILRTKPQQQNPTAHYRDHYTKIHDTAHHLQRKKNTIIQVHAKNKSDKNLPPLMVKFSTNQEQIEYSSVQNKPHTICPQLTLLTMKSKNFSSKIQNRAMISILITLDQYCVLLVLPRTTGWEK